MIKKLKNTDLLFIVSLFTGTLLLSVFLFTYPYNHDESFYASIPYRLVNGDSLVQHEWHLTQFSSLFTYLPVCLWTALKGSAEGMIVFLRSVYLLIHSTVTVLIYRFFRKHEKWAIAAAMIFFTQTPYRFIAVSYNSMFVLFTLLLTLCLLSIYEKSSVLFYILGGVCFGCCCVCNPFFCFAFILYLLICALWVKRETFKNAVIITKYSHTSENNKNVHKKQQKKKQQHNVFPNMESYSCFFCKKAIIYSSLGILMVAAISVIFFFATGGTIESIIKNISNLFASSEYTIVSLSVFSKITQTWYFFKRISFNLPYLLPLMYITMLFDKKRKENSHRCLYLICALILAILFISGMFQEARFYSLDSASAFSLPFLTISATCYILTKNKNKKLFYCMWIPCATAAVFHFTASNTLLSSLGIVFAISNIAGVFFASDLFKEIKSELNSDKKLKIKENKKILKLNLGIICIGLCLQILFHCFVFQYGQLPEKDPVRVTAGPYSGMYMTEDQYSMYEKSIADLDIIKARSNKNDPVLIASYQNWMYMYVERPMAVYTAWYQQDLKQEQLIEYYKANPDKIPKYIYITSTNYENNYNYNAVLNNIDIVSKMFEFTKEDLSNGTLLTVTKCLFD